MISKNKIKNIFLKFFLVITLSFIFSLFGKKYILQPVLVFGQENSLVINGSFEDGQRGWIFEEPNGPIEKQIVERPGYQSEKALHIKNLNQNKSSRVIQWVPIVNGQYYKLSMMLKKVNEDSNQPRIKVDEWCLSNSGNRFIKGQLFTIELINQWEKKEWFFQAGSCDTNQNHLLAIFFDTGLYQNNPIIGDIWVDDVVLQTSNPSNCLKKSQGDANCDGEINDGDYDVWKCEFLGGGICEKNPHSQKTADFDMNAEVNLIDFEIWRQNFFIIRST